MPRRILFFFVAFVLAFPVSPASSVSQRTAEPAPSGVKLVGSDASGVTLALTTPVYEILPQEAEPFQSLSVPGLDVSGAAGFPQLPVGSALIGVPPGAELSIEILIDDVQAIPGRFELMPAPSPVALEDDLQPGDQRAQPSPDIYNREGWYPRAPAQIAEVAWIRDQQVARISLYPFQYNAKQDGLLWHRQLQVRVHFFFNGPAQPRSAGECLGPCAQSSPYEPLLQSVLLNYEQARNWRVKPEVTALQSLGTQSLTPGETSYKIIVDQDGLYELTHADLSAAGLDLANVDPRYFHLSNQGRAVAIQIEGEADGRFDPGDRALFYGQKLRGDHLADIYAEWMADWLWLCSQCQLAGMFEKYTDENIYWLTVESDFGLRMSEVDGDPSGSSATIPDHYTATVRAEESHAWYSHHFSSEDTWFWERIQPGPFTVTHTYTTTLTALETSPLTATVGGELVGRSGNQHMARLYFNGVTEPIDEASWAGEASYIFTAHLPQAQLVEGENALDFVVVYSPTLQNYQDIYFNWFEVDYARQFHAEDDHLLFDHKEAGTWKYQIEQLETDAVRVFDVTAPLSPTRILNPSVALDGATYTAQFMGTLSAAAQYLVAGGNAVRSPSAILAYTPPDYAATPGADYVFITHPLLYTTTQTLADYRASQGLSTAVINLEDLINQFNYGIYHPVAIKNFLAFTFDQWSTPPAYALLVGGGHWNLKGFDGYAAPPIYMPPNLAFVDPWQGEVDSANLLATIAGDDFLPDLHIGRMPANSVAELETMIGKTIAYEQTPLQAWQEHILFVVDNVPDSAGNFIALADGIANTYLTNGGFLDDRIHLNDYCGAPTSPPTACPAMNQAITTTLNITSALLVNYIGHAAVNRWAHEKIFINADVATLNNGEALPVFLSMTCLDGYWIHPELPSLVYDLLRADGKGGVATFSATGLGVATGHDHLQHGFYASLFNNGVWELGFAADAGKVNLFTNGWSYDLLQTFTIFGDPALRILSPHGVDLAPTTTTANGEPNTTVQYTFQVTNTGRLADTYDVTLTGNSWPTQPDLSVVGPLEPGQGAAVVVSVDIPSGVSGWDTAQLDVISQGDRGRQAVSNVTTFADVEQVFLPSVRK